MRGRGCWWLFQSADDWAEGSITISKIEDEEGRRTGSAPGLPEGLEGISRLARAVAGTAPAEWGPIARQSQVRRPCGRGDRDRPAGPWSRPRLVAAGYKVYANKNPQSAAQYRKRNPTSGAKSERSGAGPARAAKLTGTAGCRDTA